VRDHDQALLLGDVSLGTAFIDLTALAISAPLLTNQVQDQDDDLADISSQNQNQNQNQNQSQSQSQSQSPAIIDGWFHVVDPALGPVAQLKIRVQAQVQAQVQEQVQVS
jgi:mannitol-specific phosphotransferase system IIBC component